MNKTFAELGYNAGDTVRCVDGGKYFYVTGKEYSLVHYHGEPTIKGHYDGYSASWELVSRAGSTDTTDYEYLTWSDMTPEAQGALLLACHNGETIQFFIIDEWVNIQFPSWERSGKYRVKPVDPVVVAHELFGRHKLFWSGACVAPDTHRLTYNTIDGVIYCASVKMMEIDK